MKKLIEFKARANRRDVYRALLDNRTLKTSQGYSVFYDSTEQEPFRINKGDADEVYIYHDHGITHEEIEVEWYDDIPEHGVLCWVWDEVFPSYPLIVYAYSGTRSHPFIAHPDIGNVGIPYESLFTFQYAKPLTTDEVKNYIFAEQLTNQLSGDR